MFFFYLLMRWSSVDDAIGAFLGMNPQNVFYSISNLYSIFSGIFREVPLVYCWNSEAYKVSTELETEIIFEDFS